MPIAMATFRLQMATCLPALLEASTSVTSAACLQCLASHLGSSRHSLRDTKSRRLLAGGVQMTVLGVQCAVVDDSIIRAVPDHMIAGHETNDGELTELDLAHHLVVLVEAEEQVGQDDGEMVLVVAPHLDPAKRCRAGA